MGMPGDEPADDELTPGGKPAAEVAKGRRSLARMRRELTDEEMANSGVQKILMDDTERLESECTTLREFVVKYHEADKKVAILKESLKQKTALDIFTGGALAAGSGLIGYAPNA